MRVTLTDKGAARVRGGLPWVYASDVQGSDGDGETCTLVDRRGTELGFALWSKASPIPVRLLGRAPVELDESFLATRVAAAIERRTRDGFGTEPDSAMRLVHAEADALPGLIVDRYADVVVLQSLAPAIDRREALLAEILTRLTKARIVVARDDGSARDLDGLPRRKGVVRGSGDTQVRYRDAGSLVEVDVLTDGKTGGYLDQVANHAVAARYATGDCLDAFTYHGGFALALCRGGATSVLALDESAAATERARANGVRNGYVQLRVETANAFDRLRQLEGEGRTFRTVVVDPPALAKRRGRGKEGIEPALRAYKELNLRALRLLEPGGVLISCSCSSRVTASIFGDMLESAARDAGRTVQLLERRGAGSDHPVLLGVPETEYPEGLRTARAAMIGEWLATLDPLELATLARRYQTLARDDGAFVTLADGAEVAIPPVVTPTVLPADERRRLATDARLLVRATDRLCRALVDSELKERVLSSLSPLERAAMVRTSALAELATARVDFLIDETGVARALEINTTIPAMQGYSDAIAMAFLRAVGEQRGLDEAAIAAAIVANGRNSDDLLASLLALHERAGGHTTAQRIAIVARPGDSQGGELDHYVRRWSALGHHALRCVPDEIDRDGRVNGKTVDLFYRHVFLRRLDPDGAFTQLLHDPRAHHVWNPPASHLELKAMLGVLSAAEPGALADDEQAAVAARLPWTRVCMAGPARGPDGAPIADLVDFVLAHSHALVLKRSWDYGGRGVFLGSELDSDSSQAKLRALIGPRDRPYAWYELVDHVVRSNEAWVVQSLVEAQAHPRLRMDDAGVVRHALYADLSAFTSLGNDVVVDGGAVRTATSRIVNIQGGGGLAPLLREEAVRAIMT